MVVSLHWHQGMSEPHLFPYNKVQHHSGKSIDIQRKDISLGNHIIHSYGFVMELLQWHKILVHIHLVNMSSWTPLHSPDGSFDSRWNSNLSLLHWIVNSTQNYNFESRWNFNSIQNCSFELNCQSNAANSSWNFILNQMIRREIVSLYVMFSHMNNFYTN